MSSGSLLLRRLRVMFRGHAVYDQAFHAGVNIIRGSNSSGKSTIADFIYFALGGENDRWKGAAKHCDRVQAEVETTNGLLTIQRDTDKPTSKASVFFGSMDEAAEHGLDSWQPFPLHRQERSESFTQLIFRSLGIPEAPSEGASNITVNQMLRLLYADQRTPTGHLFGYVPFDTLEIRRAVGDLICGLNPHETYALELELRSLKKQFDEKRLELRALVAGLPDDEVFHDLDGLGAAIASRESNVTTLERQIREVDNLVSQAELTEFEQSRQKSLRSLKIVKNKISAEERSIEALEFDLSELEHFLVYLADLEQKAESAEKTADIIGDIDFTTCPSCLKPLPTPAEESDCGVCGQKLDDDHGKSRYIAVRQDLEIQIRESGQLHVTKEEELRSTKKRLRRLRGEYQDQYSAYVSKFDLTSSPREAFLAEKNWEIGSLTKEIEYLNRMLGRAQEVRRVTGEKQALQTRIDEVEERLSALTRTASKRRASSMKLVSSFAERFLIQDLPNQEDFVDPDHVVVDFANNVVKVDGEINFSESSNVVLKNAAILALLAAASSDETFNHPKFLLMDNIEDKGMTQERSRNFQNIIVKASKEMATTHQIIFTTSMMDPDLEKEEYTIGPVYADDRKTLEFPSAAEGVEK